MEKEGKTGRTIKNLLKYLYILVWQNSLSSFLLLVIGTAGVGVSLSSVVLSKRVIDVATHAAEGKMEFLLVGLAILQVGSIGLSIIASRFAVRYQTTLYNRLSLHYFSGILHAEWKAQQTYHSGDIMSRVGTDIGDIVQLMVRTFPQFLVTLFKLTGAIIYLFILDRRLTLVLVVIIPIVLLVSKLYFKKMRKLSVLIKESQSAVRQYFQESVQNAGIAKALHIEDRMEKELTKKQKTLLVHVLSHNRFHIFSNSVLSFGFAAGYLVAFSWGVYQLYGNEITFGTMTAFLQLVAMMQGPALGLAASIPTFIVAYTALERLYELETLPKEQMDTSLVQPSFRIERITFSDIAFGYESGRQILTHADFVFEQGKMTAIAGETGCGKTTVMRLILGLISPQQGKVIVSDNKYSFQMSPAFRQRIAYVPQGNYLFSGSIRENLSLGNPDADDAAMKEALRQAAADFVFTMPAGLDSELKESGKGLSGGQIQRLAIARALLHGGEVLLLDEATASLDEKTEEEVIASLKKNVKDKIVIVVTHRQRVIDVCDVQYKLLNNN